MIELQKLPFVHGKRQGTVLCLDGNNYGGVTAAR